MALEQKLSVRMSQRLIMTPSLQQAIKLLQMSKLELVEEMYNWRSVAKMTADLYRRLAKEA